MSTQVLDPLTIRVTLNEHLQQLAGKEAAKLPSQQKEVPSLTELAQAIGIHRVTLTNLANNHMKRLNVGTLNAILNELRKRGFDSRLSDILKSYPLSEVV